MEFELYSIYDAQAQTYTPPMAQPNDAVAMRAFEHEAMNSQSLWNSHPQDFVMYKVGLFYANTGECIQYTPIERICCAADFVRKEK